MTANNQLEVTELDFNDIRNNLKNFLSSQTQFQDYDFEGAGMAVLLDILAYNTHYNAFYTNMVANEMFLDTAQQRDSIVSKAKELGYVPTSAIGATANVNIEFAGIPSNVTNFTLEKNSKFATTLDDVRYTFVTPEEYNITKNSNNVFAADISLREGTPLTYKFTVDSRNPIKYVIPNTNVDTSSIVVKVQNSETDTTTQEYTRATNIRELSGESLVYFIEESTANLYEIIFGDGALGKSVVDRNIIIVEYLACKADATNGANNFVASALSIAPANITYTGTSITTNNAASGGREAEDATSIKFNAPRSYQTQNRAVVDSDYTRILVNENADIQSVTSFGGEKALPPVYGKVYIAVKPFDELHITNTRKQQLKSSILERAPLAIDPVFIDAKYTYVIPTVKTFYDSNKTTVSVGRIKQAVRDAVRIYSETNLERFGNRLRYSKFVRELDNVEVGEILNNEACLLLEQRFTPALNQSARYEFRFNNALTADSIYSTQFTYQDYPCEIEDDGAGNITIFRYDENNSKVVLRATAGTVDYDEGLIVLNSFAPTDYNGIEISVGGKPANNDIVPVREQILIVAHDAAKISVVGESV